MAGKKIKKKKDEEENGEVDGEGEDEGKKSEDLTEDDLQKSLDQLEELAVDGDTESRKDVLLEKAKTKLSNAEKDELFELMGDEPRKEESLGEGLAKSIDDNEPLQRALDVSDYLRENHTELTKSLETLADEIEKGGNRQHQFNLVLAKAVSESGRIVLQMAERLGVIEQQPARAPKAKLSNAQPLSKSFAGQQGTDGEGGGGGEDLGKAQILDALEEMLQKSVDAGHAGITEDSEDIAVAATKMESMGQITKSMFAQVQSHIQRKGATVQ